MAAEFSSQTPRQAVALHLVQLFAEALQLLGDETTYDPHDLTQAGAVALLTGADLGEAQRFLAGDCWHQLTVDEETRALQRLLTGFRDLERRVGMLEQAQRSRRGRRSDSQLGCHPETPRSTEDSGFTRADAPPHAQSHVA